MQLLGFAISLAALASGYLGMGWPNHPYQWGLAVMGLGLALHRRWLPFSRSPLGVLLWISNATVLAMVFKLFIGGGIRTPFSWVRLPTVQNTTEGWIPKLALDWQTLALSEWQVDLTLVQSFLLLLTAVGAWTRFQPFASLTALMLLIASLPSYVDFRWGWLLPAMAAAMASFYVQAHAAGSSRRPV